jgi:hypothetical protein
MPRSRKASPGESAEAVAAALAGFDYEVDTDDFVLYELVRFIDEDRASFDDADFRRLIDEGIRAHIEENLQIRARIAGILRKAAEDMAPETSAIARRVVHALEDMESDLANAGVLVRTYTSYLFDRLQTFEKNTADEELARQWIEQWRKGEIPRDKLLAALEGNRAAAAPAADLLFESPEDRAAADVAIEVLSGVRSPVTARVLAHVVSEPLLDEDLEAKAFAALQSFWPLPRRYMLYNLRGHTHEDIPSRWFELFVRVNEVLTVELALEELRVHGGNPNYLEDLSALLSVLQGCRDPETEDKVLGAINARGFPAAAQPLLKTFLRDYRKPEAACPDPWAAEHLALDLNRRYLAAAKLFDAGKTARARDMLQEILATSPDYPFALMLQAAPPPR